MTGARGAANNDPDTQPAPHGYQWLERLGEGAAGIVYKAHQLSTGQSVAIKVLHPALSTDRAARARLVARFAREMRLCARLHHPHIVRLLDQGETPQCLLFAVFEFVPGKTLHDLLTSEGALPAPVAGELMGQVLDALAEAHAQGIVHRDLKPSNIMVSRHGDRLHAKVLDFGIGVSALDRDLASPAELTLTAETLGTPRYNAPEQLRGEPPTVNADLYSWGLTLMECLTGQPLIQGRTLAEVYHQHLSPAELPLPLALRRHPLGELLRRVLSKNPRDRGTDTSALHGRFRAIELHGLVGSLTDDAPAAWEAAATTRAAPARSERRQITMLCFRLDIAHASDTVDADLDALEEILADQLTLCQEGCTAAGGHLAGALGGARIVYFGYPQATDNAARYAARAVLELVNRVRERSQRLEARDGVRLTVRASLHTGMMVVRPGQTPWGLVIGAADRLALQVGEGAIAASDVVRDLLDRHFVLGSTGSQVRMEDGRLAPVWSLSAEREAESARPGAGFVLAGRMAESAALQALWRRTAASHPGAMLLMGEAGMGKSSLVQALCAQVLDDKGQAWVLRCAPEHRNVALAPFLRWVRVQLRLDEDPQRAYARLHAELAQLRFDDSGPASVLASWLSLPLPEGLLPVQHAPGRQRQIVLDLLRCLLYRLAQGPALLVVEDVHCADPTSREFIDALLAGRDRLKEGSKQNSSLGFILTARPETTYRPAVEVLPLQGLAPAEAEALVRRLPGTQSLRQDEVAALAARADGNPLYLIELVRARVNSRGAPQAAGIPATLRDVLGLALERLGPARKTAQLAAAIGREFEPRLLQSAARDEASVQGDLDQMLLADLVVRQRRIEGDAYVFRHALIRDAAYDSMTAPARRQTHARIALALHEQSAAEPASVAHHFALAGDVERAVPHGLRATAQSLGRALHDEALGQAALMDPWIAALPDAARLAAELDLNLVRTQALMSKFGWADARVRASAQRSQALLEGASLQNDRERNGAALWALATFHHVASDRSRVRTFAEQMVALADDGGSPALQRAALTLEGIGRWIDGRYPEAAAALERMTALPRAHADDDAARFGLDCRCWSLAALANVRWFLGDDDLAAIALAQAAVIEAEDLGHMPTLGLCLMYEAFLHQHRRDRGAAAAVCARLLDLSRRFGLPAVEAYAALVDAWRRDDSGDIAAILGDLQGMGCLLGHSYLGSLAADVAARSGDAVAALAALDRCIDQSEALHEPYYLPELLREKAALLALRHDRASLKQAADLLGEAVLTAKLQGMARTKRQASQQLQTLCARISSRPPSKMSNE